MYIKYVIILCSNVPCCIHFPYTKYNYVVFEKQHRCSYSGDITIAENHSIVKSATK